MKAKSMKLRFLVTLQALFKYSDKDHRMNTVKLNEFLRPYGLDCTSRVLSDTVQVLRDYGVDVRWKGVWDNQGIWIEDRPLPDDKLRQLVFAVSTNPFLSNEQATAALDALKPFVTVYQEPLLQSDIALGELEGVGQGVYDAYVTVCDAIRQGRRILYTITRVRCNKETGEVYEEQEWATLFMPKCIYQTKRSVYMVGYNYPDKRVEAVDLQSVSGVRFSFKHNDPAIKKVQKILDAVDPRDYVPEERRKLIYKGPVVFRCRGQYLEELVQRFGMPDEPVEKDPRCRSVFKLQEAEIWPETLDWLARTPGYGIRIMGPEELREAVRAYYREVPEALLDARLLPEKKADKNSIYE